MGKGRIDMDAMTRRLKNRERQRRYRARKRLEADMDNGSRVVSRPMHVQPEAIVENRQEMSYVSRVHSTRKWKKDARRRRAQLGTSSADKRAAAVISDLATSNNGISAQPISTSDFQMASNGLNKPKLGRRNWKAEARNKK
ncbi:unnamed protein product [Linum trigynum]|uniref:Uncharacterized protein n=1 Tax=Linum trigynum TaxID=586398 RepID=A0AAV2DRS3_9ROSI